jgi:NAD(P)-dependent dehydrogenase (short-subunit alcohol dehydrogenase family)
LKAGAMMQAAGRTTMLDGKVAIITGAGANMGRAIALALAHRGAQVACLHRRREAAETTAHAVTETGARAMALEADVACSDGVREAVAQVVASYGRVDVLVNNAAITSPAALLDESPATFRRVLDVIVMGTFLCTQHVARRMIAQGHGGAIVNVASTSGHRGKAGAIAYQAAKAAILQLTRACAIELAPYAIRVNSITPTQTGTRVGTAAPRDDERPPESVPLGRWGKPEDPAAAVAFLVSDSADFITGVDLPVDGGNLAMKISG